MNMNRDMFCLTYYKSTLKFERSLHIFRTSMLNIEIFDLNRIIDSLTKNYILTLEYYLIPYPLIYGTISLIIIFVLSTSYILNYFQHIKRNFFGYYIKTI